MHRFLTVHGRIGRGSYFLRTVALFLLCVLATVVLGLAARRYGAVDDGYQLAALLAPLSVGSWLMACQTGKRAHDLGHSAWIALLLLVPAIGFGLIAYLLIWPAPTGDNQYGAPAKG